jgi:homospermidine synthase
MLIGCHGSLGRAVLALLENSAPGQRLRSSLDALILVDRERADRAMPPGVGKLLPPATVASPEDLAGLVQEHRITQVVDVSSIDTVDCTQVCDRLGTDFLCTSVEEWPERGSLPTDEAIARLLPPLRPVLKRHSHLVGSGANPGIVNALTFVALAEFATRVGVAATSDALDLSAILITEEDTTVDQDAPDGADVFPMTWSPIHCLEELFEPVAFAARSGKIVSLGHKPTSQWYSARCGEHTIEGMAVPHEEIATLARHLSSIEIGFIYRIPPAARRALAEHSHRTSSQGWRTHRLCPPWTARLAGQDRVGVLLSSRRFGELWMGFETDVAMGLSMGTNATQLQVAAGVLAGWTQLGNKNGIHFVEDLDRQEFVRVASEVLGPPRIVHDPSAVSQPLADRRSVS